MGALLRAFPDQPLDLELGAPWPFTVAARRARRIRATVCRVRNQRLRQSASRLRRSDVTPGYVLRDPSPRPTFGQSRIPTRGHRRRHARAPAPSHPKLEPGRGHPEGRRGSRLRPALPSARPARPQSKNTSLLGAQFARLVGRLVAFRRAPVYPRHVSQTPSIPRKPYIGGQAVIEGVMMRSPKSFVVAVRRHAGGIAIREQAWETLWPTTQVPAVAVVPRGDRTAGVAPQRLLGAQVLRRSRPSARGRRRRAQGRRRRLPPRPVVGVGDGG